MPSAEFDFIDRIRQLAPTRPEVLLGIGDDASLLQIPGQCVVSTDIVMDGTDFHLAQCGWKAAGRKALAVNLSDMAAMAATPIAVFIGLVLPSSASTENCDQLMSGIMELASEFHVAVAGGDTNTWDGKLAISVTILGSVAAGAAVRRHGAQPGDLLCVTGPLGGSISGHHLTFTPRINAALWLAKHCQINAMLDLSDGLASDLRHLAQESRVGFIIDAERIPISPAALQQATLDSLSPLEHALGDGEDFELLLTLSRQDFENVTQKMAGQQLDFQLIPIGEATTDLQLKMVMGDGSVKILPDLGYRHQFDQPDPL